MPARMSSIIIEAQRKKTIRCVEEFSQKGSSQKAKKVTYCFLIGWIPIVSCDHLYLLGREITPGKSPILYKTVLSYNLISVLPKF